MTNILKYFPSHLSAPRQAQVDILKQLERDWDRYDVFVISAPVALGKCHGFGQPVLMYDGSIKKIEDIQVGEHVMGPDSKPRQVLNTTQGKEPIYRIKPRRGDSWTATGNHKLHLLRYTRSEKGGIRQYKQENIDVPLLDYIKKSENYKRNSFMSRVGVDFTEQKLSIPPYILGIWLGDGLSKTSAICNMDKPIINAWLSWGHSLGCEVREHNNGSKASSYFLKTERGKINPALHLFKQYNLINNKYIPDIYLHSSRQQRLELFAGILDTDGCVDRNKSSIEIVQVREKLIDNIKYLASSLGFSVTKHTRIINNKPYYRLTISGTNIADVKPLLTYKQPINSQNNQCNYKFEVEELGVNNYAGIEVDGDHLYLLGDFTISHNSAIASTIASWSGSAAVITPNNLLRNQYAAEYPDMHVIRRRAEYRCTTHDQTSDETYKQFKKLCPRNIDCEGCNKYRIDVEALEHKPVVMGNYYGYFGYGSRGAYKSTLVIDEAHNLGNMLRELSGHKLWQFEAGYPTHLRTRLDMMTWAESLTEQRLEEWPLLKLFRQQILSSSPNYLFQMTWEYHGKKSVDRHDKLQVIKMLPVDLRGLQIGSNFVWPYPSVRKLVLMSATISKLDVDQFGLGSKRICYIEADSPIAPERRPVVIPAEARSMAYAAQEENIPELINFLNILAAGRASEKGLIHVTYSLSRKLQMYLADNPRFLFHTKYTKSDIYRQFRESTEPKILVGAGMAEGIDLAGDLCRFQVIAKIPYPSLADPALRFMASRDNTWYSWQAVKDTIQATGRVCRGPDDWGETIIYDSSFTRLYTRNPELFPRWFTRSLVWPTNLNLENS